MGQQSEPPSRADRDVWRGFWMHPTEPDAWPDGHLEEAQAAWPVSPISTLRLLRFQPSLPTFCLLDESETPPPPRQTLPIWELPPRRKVVWIWICCYCGHGGMKVSVDPCPRCSTPRCPTCHIQRFNVRGANKLPELEGEDESEDEIELRI
ncbi:hypothetical protein B0J13DRAFT_565570 [Dactylonectria estremocensis]|uniref:Uncharacterized protein n=1 Tax=Dactylonectria estremocensis TaxID=1079267 RepID=A0A9P9IPE7_9HYPO|nr:hypothetical protein B0J13DRAFT_565570 [Dactylonectria estremocensis]